MFSALFACLSIAHALDPWGRPEHLRVVRRPPTDFADLSARRVPLRLWWDVEEGAQYEVQAQLGGQWKTLTRTAVSGWTSRPLPPSTAFRVRRSDTAGVRWSDVVTAPPWASPTDLARLAGPEQAVLAGGIGQIAVVDSTVWASVLGGGLVKTSAASTGVQSMTRWDGLPDDTVIAVHAQGDHVLVGTATGAALIEAGVVVKMWDESLPDPYVQSVLIGASALWLGTYQGLARVVDDDVATVLEPWSVFSLTAERSGEIWVGYEGFRRLDAVGNQVYPPPQSPPSPQVEEDADDTASPTETTVVSHEDLLRQDLERVKVYGTALTGSQRWLATENHGLLLFTDDDINHVDGYADHSVYSVAQNAQGMWAAADARGLMGPNGLHFDRADGLPSDTVWSVAGVGSDLWVGTDQGLAWLRLDADGQVRSVRPRQHSTWPADRSAVEMLVRPSGAFVAGEDGVWHVGQPHRAAGNLSAAAGENVVALLAVDDWLWSVGETLVGLDRRGQLVEIPLPAPAVDAVVWNGEIWVVDGERLWRFDSEKREMMWVSALPGVVQLTANEQAMWAVNQQGHLSRVLMGASRPFPRVRQVIDAQPSDDGYVCVGTADGLVRLFEDSGDVEDVLERRDRGVSVPAVAVDPAGGCWFAAEDGTVGRAQLDGREAYTYLPSHRVGTPQRIVVDGPDSAWVLTSRGTWRVQLPALGAQ